MRTRALSAAGFALLAVAAEPWTAIRAETASGPPSHAAVSTSQEVPNTAHADAPEPRPAAEEPAAAVRLTRAEEARARAIEGGLRCPVCRSQSIRQSRSFMAEDMRRKVRAMIAEGRSDEEIRGFFVDRYGTWVLLTPPRRGFNLAAYVFPAIVVLIGAAGLVLAARRWKSAAGPAPQAPPPATRHLAMLERELEETE